MDIWSKATPTLYLLLKKAERRPIGPHNPVSVLDIGGPEATPFEGHDQVSTMAVRGPQAINFTPTQYSIPINLALTDELNFSGPHAIGSWTQSQAQNAMMKFGQTLSRDIFRGNNTETKRIVGLEQLFYPVTHINPATGVTAVVASRVAASWQARQSTNSYGGVTRTAFTADGVAGTGLESVVANFFDAQSATAGKFRYSSTAPHAPDIGLQCLSDLVASSTYGGMMGDRFIVSTRKPFDDYSDAVSTKTSFNRDGMSFNGGDLGISKIMYQGIPWFWDDWAATWNTFGAGSAAGDNNIYCIDTSNLGLVVDSRLDMVLTQPRSPYNQHSSVKFALMRLMHYCLNPRVAGFRGYDYPTG